MKFLHELDDAEELFRVIADEKAIDPYLVEKDYWIMHALWGLQQQLFLKKDRMIVALLSCGVHFL